jgi:hypothetical protein
MIYIYFQSYMYKNLIIGWLPLHDSQNSLAEFANVVRYCTRVHKYTQGSKDNAGPHKCPGSRRGMCPID